MTKIVTFVPRASHCDLSCTLPKTYIFILFHVEQFSYGFLTVVFVRNMLHVLAQRAAGGGRWIAGGGPAVVTRLTQSRTGSHGSPAAGHGPRAAGQEPGGGEPRTREHGPRRTLQIRRTTGHGPRTTNHEPRTTNHEPPGTGHAAASADHGPRRTLRAKSATGHGTFGREHGPRGTGAVLLDTKKPARWRAGRYWRGSVAE